MKLKRNPARSGLLFLGVIAMCNVLHIAEASKNKNYPEEVPKSMLSEGCWPWVEWQCPARMNCYIDFNYAKFGQCGCRNGWFYRMAPPKNLGKELAPAPHRNDCVGMGPINILSFICWFSAWLVWCYLTFGSMLTIYRVYKNGGLKMNSSTIAFVLFPCACLGEVLRHLVFWTNRVGLDPYWHIKDAVLIIGNYLMNQFSPWMTLESICTWFDLYQKSRTLSKRSTRLIGVLRWTLRIFATTQGISTLLIYIGIKPGQAKLGDAFQLITDISLWTLMFCTGICGPLISRVLCKDIKDVTNPNWKAAAAIRTTALNYLVCLFIFWCCLNRGIYEFGLYGNQALAMNNTLSYTMFTASLITHWGWYQYLLFAHRRYLENYDISASSTLFYGFSTIGLKGSRASSISQSSTTSSVNSTTSAVSSVSVADGEKAEGEKGAMA